MLRVAYLFERFPSFAQTFCYREVAELIRQGVEVAVFSIRRPVDEPTQDWDEKILRKVTYLPEEKELVAQVGRAVSRGALPEAAARSLKEWDRQTDFLRLYQAAFIGLRLQGAGLRRVHAHFAGMAARTAYWLCHFFGIDYSLTAHANDIFAPQDFVISLAKIFHGARAIVTVSDFAAEQLRREFPHEATKIRRVYNGVELERFSEAQFNSDIPLLISVGRLIEKKGISDLIAACDVLKRGGRKFRCEIIGEGPLEAALARQIANGQLQDRVQLIGPQTQVEIAQRLAAANLFVLPCVKEAGGGMDNLPTVIVEAMASGLPVISTPIAGIPEMVEPGLTGELVPEHDPAALAGAIAQLISQPELARRLGSRGRQRAAEKFAIAANARTLMEILSY
ncbi:MAG: glycosyltransferase family 4 protein [Chthoniobacterales bacterium]